MNIYRKLVALSKEERREQQREYEKRPETIAMRKKNRSTPDAKAKKKAYQKKYDSKPGVMAKKSSHAKIPRVVSRRTDQRIDKKIKFLENKLVKLKNS